MKFFIPLVKDKDLAEVYRGIAKFIGAPVKDKRIWKLAWRHNSKNMQCEVGKRLCNYYKTKNEPVLAIFDCWNVYKICTTNRGGQRGGPILANKGNNSSATYFDEN